MKPKKLKTVKKREVQVFKIANRRGYAVVALNNLTEGRSVPQALARMAKALKRHGLVLPAGM